MSSKQQTTKLLKPSQTNKTNNFINKCASLSLFFLVPQTIILVILLVLLGISSFSPSKKDQIDKVEGIIDPNNNIPITSTSVPLFAEFSTKKPSLFNFYLVRFTYHDKEYTRNIVSDRVYSTNEKITVYLVNGNTDNIHLEDPALKPSLLSFFKKFGQALFWIILIILVLNWVIYFKFKTFTCMIVIINVVLIAISIFNTVKIF